jgi:hypothetical protein
MAAREGALNKLSPALGAGCGDANEFRGRGDGHHKVRPARHFAAAASAAAHSDPPCDPAQSAGLSLLKRAFARDENRSANFSVYRCFITRYIHFPVGNQYVYSSP